MFSCWSIVDDYAYAVLNVLCTLLMLVNSVFRSDAVGMHGCSFAVVTGLYV